MSFNEDFNRGMRRIINLLLMFLLIMIIGLLVSLLVNNNGKQGPPMLWVSIPNQIEHGFVGGMIPTDEFPKECEAVCENVTINFIVDCYTDKNLFIPFRPSSENCNITCNSIIVGKGG